MRIGIIGGTGKEGRGLGARWARAGHDVFLGSRDEARAQAAAAELSGTTGKAIAGGSNIAAVAHAEVALLAVPYTAHKDTLAPLAAGLAGKILVDITVPLKPPAVRVVNLPEGMAAALEAQALVGKDVAVVAALHHISAVHLADPEHHFESDVLFCTDDARARGVTATRLRDLGAFPVDAGALKNAIALEAMTPVLLHLNKTYGVVGTGVRIVGIPR